MFPAEPLIFPVAPSPTAALSLSITTPFFLSWALYLIPHTQTISQSCRLYFPNVSRIWPPLTTSIISCLPMTVASQQVALLHPHPRVQSLPSSADRVVHSRFSFHWGNDPQGPRDLSELIYHSVLCSLCLSSTNLLAVPQIHQASFLFRMLSPWAYTAMVLTEHLMLCKVRDTC